MLMLIDWSQNDVNPFAVKDHSRPRSFRHVVSPRRVRVRVRVGVRVRVRVGVRVH